MNSLAPTTSPNPNFPLSSHSGLLTRDNNYLHDHGFVNGKSNGTFGGQFNLDFPQPHFSHDPLPNWIVEPESGEASYEIGHRYRSELNERGETIVRVFPLSLQDFLHPLEGDEFVPTVFHNEVIDAVSGVTGLLKLAIQERLGPLAALLPPPNEQGPAVPPQQGEIDDVVFLIDVEMDLELPNGKFVRPDFVGLIGVITQIGAKLKHKGIFRIGIEPHIQLKFILEVGSKTTESVDLNQKVEIYAKAGFEQYLFIRPQEYDETNDSLVLHNFVLNPVTRQYEKQAPNQDGSVSIPFLRVKIMPRLNAEGQPEVRSLITDEPINNLKNEVRAKLQEKRRADDEKRRADDEKRRADDEKRRADETAQKLADEKVRADDEKRRADETAQKLADEKIRADKAISDAEEVKRQLEALKLLLQQTQQTTGS